MIRFHDNNLVNHFDRQSSQFELYKNNARVVYFLLYKLNKRVFHFPLEIFHAVKRGDRM